MVDLVGIEPTTSSMPWRPQLYIQQLTSGSGNCQFLVSTCRNAVPKRILGWTLGSPAPLSRCLWQESASQSRTVPHSYKSVELGWCREPGRSQRPTCFLQVTDPRPWPGADHLSSHGKELAAQPGIEP